VGNGEASTIDFSVVIAASAPVEDNVGLVHAVTVIQPTQTWTVIRGQDDFYAIAENLSSQFPDLPPFPDIAKQPFGDNINNNNDHLLPIVTARTHLQHWLESILMYPGARDSQVIRNFLTYAPNMIPPQYETVSWTIFTADGQVASPPASDQQQQQQQDCNPQTGVDNSSSNNSGYDDSNLDDMAMDDMFETGDGDYDDSEPAQHDDDSDDEDEYRASIRYKACDDSITEEDEMDLAHVIAGEVEMIDDVGSLAQSLGASHLGRSIMLQEENMGGRQQQQQHPHYSNQQQQHLHQQVLPPTTTGVQLGSRMSGSSTGSGGGGIGSAMKEATMSTQGGLGGTCFKPPKPESAPRLDAFKMIKVIGKGSFGKFIIYIFCT
jgi:hypothetical protein